MEEERREDWNETEVHPRKFTVSGLLKAYPEYTYDEVLAENCRHLYKKMSMSRVADLYELKGEEAFFQIHMYKAVMREGENTDEPK